MTALNQILQLCSDNLLGEMRPNELPAVFSDLRIESLVTKQPENRVCKRTRIVADEHVHSRRQVEALQACAVSDYWDAKRHRLGDLTLQSTAEPHRRNRDVAGPVNLAYIGHEPKDFHARTRQCLDFAGWRMSDHPKSHIGQLLSNQW